MDLNQFLSFSTYPPSNSGWLEERVNIKTAPNHLL